MEAIKSFLDFVLAVTNAVAKALEDGKVSLTELIGMLPTLTKLPAAVGAINDLPASLEELTESEMAELKAWIKEKLQLDPGYEEVEILLERSYALALEIASFAAFLAVSRNAQ